MLTSEQDVIVVGGGHNGLVSAAYFARSGARTLLLEARDRVGGAADTSSPFPEHPEIKVSTYSYVMAVMPPSIIRDLDLERHGPLLMQVPPRLGSRSPGDLLAQARMGWKLRKLDARGVADLTRLFAMSVSDLVDAWFESPEVKGAIAAGAVIGAWSGPDAPGTAYALLHHSMSDVGDGAMDSWGYPHGGMGAACPATSSPTSSAGARARAR